MKINYLPYKKIDKLKWDNCIDNAVNGLIYARSFYLDCMAANWDALVFGDYEAVMPLTWKRKWGIKYLYQPAFIQQGGIFYKNKLSPETKKSFIHEAFERFKFAEITLNYSNIITFEKDDVTVTLRNNFILKLGTGYKIIYKDYDPYIKQRLNRLSKFSLQYKPSENYAEAIQLYKTLYDERFTALSDKDYLNFEMACKYFTENDGIILRHVYNTDGNELMALVLLLKDSCRIYNIISCILPKGKKYLANYFLYNELIKEFADENLILDFEGSDVPGIAYFYSKFAKNNQTYPFIKSNRLPLPVKLLKK